MDALAIVGVLLFVMGAWLLITGKNFPGWLGRGFTKTDDPRTKRMPSKFYRAIGVFSILAGSAAFFLAWIISLFPNPSIQSLAIMDASLGIFALALGASLAWLLVIGAKHRLFWWDKP